MSYTMKDLERAQQIEHPFGDTFKRDKLIAQLIADVRREALEEAAVLAEWGRGAPERIRALKGGAP